MAICGTWAGNPPMSDKPLIFKGLYNNYTKLFKEIFTMLEDSPGAVAEFGVYEGNTTKILAAHGREVYAFDTFEGMPNSTYDPRLDGCNPPGKFRPRVSVEQELSTYPNIHIVKGLFADTLPTVPQDLKFILAYIDCDHYLSHKQVLDWLPDYLLPNAVLVFDDYKTCPGAKVAIDEFIAIYKLLGLNLELVENKVIIFP